MDIQEIKKAKEHMDANILRSIREFEQNTGLIVDCIRTKNEKYEIGRTRQTYLVESVVFIN